MIGRVELDESFDKQGYDLEIGLPFDEPIDFHGTPPRSPVS